MVGNGGLSDEVLAAILERERQFPTGIGYGVAVPHGKTPALSALVVVAGTTPAPVPYETIDGEPVRLFFLLAGPESAAGADVKAHAPLRRAAGAARGAAGAAGRMGAPAPRPRWDRVHRSARPRRDRPGRGRPERTGRRPPGRSRAGRRDGGRTGGRGRRT